MIEPSDFEVLDYKKSIIYNIIDYDSSITNNIISEDKKQEILKLNEEINDIVRKGKLEISIRNEFW